MAELFTRVHDELPVFKIDHGQSMILYTPGSFVTLKKISASALMPLLKDPSNILDTGIRDSILSILKGARDAVADWDVQMQDPFSVDCLTIHVGMDCNLDCVYCFSRIKKTGNWEIEGFPDLKMIRGIIQKIAEKRGINQNRLTVVYHGSGEPTLHWRQLVNSHNAIIATAEKHGLQVFTYISTNGYLKDVQLDWLSENINLIGISCDGPADIQNKQRTQNIHDFPELERICERLSQRGGHFEIRATITPETCSKQLAIVKYFVDQCMASNVRFEPVYLAGENGFKEEHADAFLNSFLLGREYAKKKGADLSYAGVRLNELHGTYCDVLRNTIRLTADGLFRNCFCFMTVSETNIIGRYKTEQSPLEISPDISQLKNNASRIPYVCKDCINVFHCSRSCPDFCLFNKDQIGMAEPDVFRCRLHQLYTVDRLKEMSTYTEKKDGYIKRV